jgi:hypothetical protein
LEGEIAVGNRLIALAALALAIVLAGAGCGGGSGDGDATAESVAAGSLSKAEFIEKGDEICTKAGEQSQSEFADFVKENNITAKKGPSEAQFGEVGETILIPLLQQQLDELRALGAPKGDEAEIKALLEAIEASLEEVEKEPAVASSLETLLAAPDKLSQEYGFKVCGKR